MVNIPEGITKIAIIDGSRGDSIVLDEGDVKDFFSKLDSATGTVEYVGEGTGYRYGVICYRDYTMVMSFDFMSEKIIRENVGEAGVDRHFIAKDTIPAYEYIERLFEKTVRPDRTCWRLVKQRTENKGLSQRMWKGGRSNVVLF
ncbi:MAG: hypothetical protein K6F26_07720 [Lachnospiraceae bacterium]|nr:hypothetical protein [Lachnospiraceae bacterium]